MTVWVGTTSAGFELLHLPSDNTFTTATDSGSATWHHDYYGARRLLTILSGLSTSGGKSGLPLNQNHDLTTTTTIREVRLVPLTLLLPQPRHRPLHKPSFDRRLPLQLCLPLPHSTGMCPKHCSLSTTDSTTSAATSLPSNHYHRNHPATDALPHQDTLRHFTIQSGLSTT